jgi:hypothetical protein
MTTPPNPADGDTGILFWTPSIPDKKPKKKKKAKIRRGATSRALSAGKAKRTTMRRRTVKPAKPRAKAVKTRQVASPPKFTGSTKLEVVEANWIKRGGKAKPKPKPRAKGKGKSHPDQPGATPGSPGRPLKPAKTKASPWTLPPQTDVARPGANDVGATPRYRPPLKITPAPRVNNAGDVGTYPYIKSICTPQQMKTPAAMQTCKLPDVMAGYRRQSRVIMPPLPGQMWGYDPQRQDTSDAKGYKFGHNDKTLPAHYWEKRLEFQFIDWLNWNPFNIPTLEEKDWAHIDYPDGGVINP